MRRRDSTLASQTNQTCPAHVGLSNASNFLLKEDHALDNILSDYLKRHRYVLIAGYNS